MSSKRDAGHSSPVIIIDDSDSEISENSTPIIIIDDDSVIENPAADLNTKSRDLQINFKQKQSVIARKRLMNLLRQGYELNEARRLVSTSAEEKGAYLDKSVPNAPKWPIAGVLTVSNAFKSGISPEAENFSNIPNEDIFFKEHESQNLGEHVENKSFCNSFENHIQNNDLSQRALTPILQQHENPSSTTESIFGPRVHIKAGSKRCWIGETEEEQPKAKRFKVSNNNELRRKHFARQNHSNSIYNNFIGIELAIVPAKLSEENLRIHQFKALREAILEQILTIKSNDIKPSFFRSYITTNELVITCCNEDTVDWLKTVVKKIKEWDGVDLQVVHRNHFPRRNYVIGYLPNSHGMSYKNILHFIDAQNHGFNIAQWKILTKIEHAGNVSFVKFSVDDDSIETLRGNEWKMHFKLKRIKLKLVGSRKMKVPQQF